jgi:hypothetical protein
VRRSFIPAVITPPPELSPAVRPWTTEVAYAHAMLLGNDGVIIRQPTSWFHPAGNVRPRIAIYAHGGLNSEAESLQRIRILAPYFEANGIHPLFISWKTSVLETLRDIIVDQMQRLPRPDTASWDRLRESVTDAVDRVIEIVAGPFLKPVWSQMKQNAALSLEDGHGLKVLARALTQLRASKPELEIHLVGHSAGSVLLGHLLTQLGATGIGVASCALYAPACDFEFALQHYGTAIDSERLSLEHFHLYVLSDQRERQDSVGPYRMSLLYLVSNALENYYRTPLLGLARALEGRTEAGLREYWHPDTVGQVRQWQQLWQRGPKLLHIVTAPQLSTGTLGPLIKAAHGSFDNSAEAINMTLSEILGGPPAWPVEWLDY